VRDKGLLYDVHAGLLDPGLRREVGASRQIADKAEFCEQQRSRALRADQLASWVQSQAREQCFVVGDLPSLDAASDDHGIGLGGELQRPLPLNDHAVHRRNALVGRCDVGVPALRSHTIEDSSDDERVQFVVAVKSQDCDLHGNLVGRAQNKVVEK
jgi:hypothetical protein